MSSLRVFPSNILFAGTRRSLDTIFSRFKNVSVTSSHAIEDIIRKCYFEGARTFEAIQIASRKSSQATRRSFMNICSRVQKRATEAAGIFSGVTTSICREFVDSSALFLDSSLKSAEAVCNRVQKRSVESFTTVGRSLKSAADRFDAKAKHSVRKMSQLMPQLGDASATHCRHLIGSATKFAHKSNLFVNKIVNLVVDRATASQDRLNSSILLASESLSNLTVQTPETALLKAGISVAFSSIVKQNVSFTPSSHPRSNEDDCPGVPVPTTALVVGNTIGSQATDPMMIPTANVFLKGGKVMSESLLENTHLLKAATHSAALKLDEPSHKLRIISQSIGKGIVDDGAAKTSFRYLKTNLDKSRRFVFNFVGRVLSKAKSEVEAAAEAAQSNIDRTRQSIGQCAQRSSSMLEEHSRYGFKNLKLTVDRERQLFVHSARRALSRIEKGNEVSKKVIRHNLTNLRRVTCDISSRTISNLRRGTELSIGSLKKNVIKIRQCARSARHSVEVLSRLHFDDVTNVRLAQMDRRLSSLHTLSNDQLPILWERSMLFFDQLIRRSSAVTTASMTFAQRKMGIAALATRRFTTELVQVLTKLLKKLLETSILLGGHLSMTVAKLSSFSANVSGKLVRNTSLLAVDSLRSLLEHTVSVLSTSRVVIPTIMRSIVDLARRGVAIVAAFCTETLVSVYQRVSRLSTMIVLKFQATTIAIKDVVMARREALFHDLAPKIVAMAEKALRETNTMFVSVLRFVKSYIISAINEVQAWPRHFFDFLIELRQRESFVVHQIAHDLDMVLEQNPREAIRWLRKNGWKSYVKQQPQHDNNRNTNDDVDGNGVSQHHHQQQQPQRPRWYR